MTNTIYYYSGTGNALWVSKQLEASIPNSTLIDISTIINQKNIHPTTNMVGIITPVYFNGMPRMVENFLKNLELDKGTYLYSIATPASTSSDIFEQMSTMLDYKLSYSKHIKMPSNYLRKFNPTDKTKSQELLDKAKEVIAITSNELINQQSRQCPKQNFALKFMHSNMRKSWLSKLNTIDKDFYVDSKCTSCGLCEKSCPVNNISLVDSTPKWNGNCEDCLRCINMCPQESIQICKVSTKRRRYLNPEISKSFFYTK